MAAIRDILRPSKATGSGGTPSSGGKGGASLKGGAGHIYICPRFKCDLQSPVLVRCIAHCQKPNSCPFLELKNLADRRSRDFRLQISAITGWQAKTGTENGLKEASLYCVPLIHPEYFSPMARLLKGCPFCAPMHFAKGWSGVHNDSILLWIKVLFN